MLRLILLNIQKFVLFSIFLSYSSFWAFHLILRLFTDMIQVPLGA